MKKISVALIVLTLLLSGCNVPFMGKAPDEVTQAENQTDTSMQTELKTQQLNQTKTSEVPSTDDGTLYLQALSAGKVELCAKVANAGLQKNCRVKLTPTGK